MSSESHYDLDGYVRLLDAFVSGKLRAEPFHYALIRLWTADRDLREGYAGPEREERAIELMEQARAGGLEPLRFGDAWGELWACGHARPSNVQHVLDGLHYWCCAYLPDPEIRASAPGFYIDEAKLLELVIPLRDELARLIRTGHRKTQ